MFTEHCVLHLSVKHTMWSCAPAHVQAGASGKLQISQEGTPLFTPSTTEEALNLNGSKRDVDEIWKA